MFGIGPVPSVKKVASHPQHLLSHHLTGFDLITTDVESTPSKTCDWPENKDLKKQQVDATISSIVASSYFMLL